MRTARKYNCPALGDLIISEISKKHIAYTIAGCYPDVSVDYFPLLSQERFEVATTDRQELTFTFVGIVQTAEPIKARLYKPSNTKLQKAA